MSLYVPARLQARYGQVGEISFDDLAKILFDKQANQPVRALITAPYGRGKTRLCQELKERAQVEGRHVKLFRGRDFVTDGDEISAAQKSMASNEEFTIIDALDELPDLSILRGIFAALQSAAGPVVLTSRTTLLDTLIERLWTGEYRPTLSAFLTSYDVELFDLNAFTEGDAISYLKASSIPIEQIDLLREAPIWEEIVSHPLWLTILVDVYESGEYELIVDLWVLLDRHVKQVLRKSHTSEGLLFSAFRDTALALTFSKQIRYQHIVGIDLTYWALVEQSGKNVAFKHRIFLDYFLVDFIKSQFKSGNFDVLTRILLSDIQIQLLSSSLKDYGFEDFVTFLKEKDGKFEVPNTDYLGANVAELLRHRTQKDKEQRTHQVSELLNIYGNFPSANLRNISLTGIKAKRVDLKNAFLGGANITHSTFEKCNFEGTDFGDKVGVVDCAAGAGKLAIVCHSGLTHVFEDDGNLQEERVAAIPGATACCFTDQGLVIGFQNGTVQIYDHELKPISPAEPLHSDKVMDVVADDKVIASASCDGTVAIWNRDSNSQQTRQVHNDLCHGLDISSATESIISVGYDRRLVTTSYLSGAEIRAREVSDKSVYSCKFSPNGQAIAVGGYGAIFKVLNARDLVEIAAPKNAHASTIWCVEWLSNTKVAIVGWDKTISVYDTESGLTERVEYPCYNSKIVRTDTGVYVSTALDRKLSYLDPSTLEERNSTQLDVAQDIEFERVELRRCYGLSPTRIDLLSKAGASITKPISVIDKKFGRNRLIDKLRWRQKLSAIDALFSELSNYDGYWIFSDDLTDIRADETNLRDIAGALLEALKGEGTTDRDLINELNRLISPEDGKELRDRVDVDKVLQRLSNIQGTGTLISVLATKLAALLALL